MLGRDFPFRSSAVPTKVPTNLLTAPNFERTCSNAKRIHHFDFAEKSELARTFANKGERRYGAQGQGIQFEPIQELTLGLDGFWLRCFSLLISKIVQPLYGLPFPLYMRAWELEL